MQNGLFYSSESDLFSGAIVIAIIIISLIIGLIVYALGAFIFYKTAKTNGFDDAAYISWIPIINLYMLFLLSADGIDLIQRRANAKKWFWIYIGLLILSMIPIIGFIFAIVATIISLYAYYKLFYRWNAEKNKSILFTVANIITGGIFFIVYGFMCMNQPFKA